MLKAILFLKKIRLFFGADDVARVDALRLQTSRDRRSVKLAKEVEEHAEREELENDDDDNQVRCLLTCPQGMSGQIHRIITQVQIKTKQFI